MLFLWDCCCLFNPFYKFPDEHIGIGDGGDDDPASAEEMLGAYRLPREWDALQQYYAAFDYIDVKFDTAVETERRELESIEGEWIPHMAFEFSSNELRLAVRNVENKFYKCEGGLRLLGRRIELQGSTQVIEFFQVYDESERNKAQKMEYNRMVFAKTTQNVYSGGKPCNRFEDDNDGNTRSRIDSTAIAQFPAPVEPVNVV